LGDGKQKFRHQATFEVVFSLIMSLKFASVEYVERTWAWLLPFLLKIFEGMLRPDNVGYWRTFVTSLLVWLNLRERLILGVARSETSLAACARVARV
jgi:hypothetical protein